MGRPTGYRVITMFCSVFYQDAIPPRYSSIWRHLCDGSLDRTQILAQESSVGYRALLVSENPTVKSLPPDSMSGSCPGYHWSHGQYMLSNCTQESSTFFIILGFTMLVLLLLLGIILVISCFRRQNQADGGFPTEPDAQRNSGNCVIQVDGAGAGGSHFKDLDSVKCVIMAGEEKPTYLAHPAKSHSVTKDISREPSPETSKEALLRGT